MFTGIVRTVGKISDITTSDQARRITVETPLAQDLEVGASIAVDGVCLTVEVLDKNTFAASVMPQTTKLTNLGKNKVGNTVNLEPSLRVGDEIGGHFVFGHIDCVGEVINKERDSYATLLAIRAPKEFVEKFIALRGSVAVSGVSLTVVDVTQDSFTVSLVSYTLKHTTLEERVAGDTVNLEADMLARYTQK